MNSLLLLCICVVIISIFHVGNGIESLQIIVLVVQILKKICTKKNTIALKNKHLINLFIYIHVQQN